jgi:succinate dehydrogenase flavin-adding protein (antitoxin of CptAB toxin-antitoxin module)
MDREQLIRRLKFQARRRSTLELEELLGRLVDRAPWETFSDRELLELEAILGMDEMSLQNALMSREPAPQGIPGGLWDRVLELTRRQGC